MNFFSNGRAGVLRKRPRPSPLLDDSERSASIRRLEVYDQKEFSRQRRDLKGRVIEDGSRILDLLADPTSDIADSRSTGENRHHLPREVFIWFFLDRIDEIDTVKQVFQIEMVFSARWMEDCPSHIRVRPEDARWETLNFEWTPRLKFVNLVSEDVERREEHFDVYSESDFRKLTPAEHSSMRPSSVWVKQTRRVKAVFADLMDVRRFPFDCQLLTMTLTTAWPSDSVLLRFCDREPCANMMAHTTHLQEYAFFPPRLVAYDQPGAMRAPMPLMSDPDWSRTGAQYSWLHIAPVAVRHAAPHLRNVALPQLLLTSMVFATFFISPDELANRLQVDISLVLATITFRFVIVDQIPKARYVTYLGLYCLVSMFFLFCIVVENTLASVLNLSTVEEAPLVYLFTVCWILINLSGLVIMLHSRHSRFQYCEITRQLFDEFSANLRPSVRKFGECNLSIDELEEKLLLTARNRALAAASTP